jgi:hypothetical protein
MRTRQLCSLNDNTVYQLRYKHRSFTTLRDEHYTSVFLVPIAETRTATHIQTLVLENAFVIKENGEISKTTDLGWLNCFPLLEVVGVRCYQYIFYICVGLLKILRSEKNRTRFKKLTPIMLQRIVIWISSGFVWANNSTTETSCHWTV